MKMILMGTGTSHGVPVIGCNCKVCRSHNKKNKRLRCSAWISEPVSLVVDTGPEFRMQALKYGIKKVDAVFITHSHADHLNGLDDLRVFSHTKAVDPAHPENRETEGEGLPIYTNTICIKDTKNRFDYIFTPVKEGGGKPKLNLINVDDFKAAHEVCFGAVKVIPVPLKHGSLPDTGWLFTEEKNGIKKSIAYLTDCSAVEESSIELIKNNCGCLEHLVIDGLRVEPHSTHFSYSQALEVAEKLCPKHTWLTHITHNMPHKRIQKYVKEQLKNFPALESVCKNGGTAGPAWDGLVLEI